MLLEGARFKIYVGRTGSIRRRVTDYAIGFQLHSPNDFKLRFFEEAVREAFPAAVPKAECGEREKSYIRMLRPLVNTLPPATEEERAPVRDAFRTYYRGVFARSLLVTPDVPRAPDQDRNLRAAIANHVRATFSDRVVRWTTPIFWPDRRRQPEALGSAIVLQMGPARFLLSAAHIRNRWREHPHAIVVGDELVRLSGAVTPIQSADATSGSDDDRLDVAILRLPADAAQRVAADQVVTVADLELDTEPADNRSHQNRDGGIRT